MEKQSNENKNKIKRLLLMPKGMLIGLVIVGLVAFAGNALMYVINDKTFKDLASEVKKYNEGTKIDPEGGIVRDESSSDIGDVWNKIEGIEDYLKDDEESTKEEKLQYLLNAELVSKSPYLSSIEGDDSKLNGIVKFYRFTNPLGEGDSSPAGEQIEMIYTAEETFKQMLNSSKRTGNEEIFKYYTINEDNEVVIAVWKETTKEVTTDDPEITVGTLNDPTYTFSEGEDGVFVANKKTITSRNLIKYNKLVEKYTMPFNLLWAFLVQTNDYKLTAEIAKLAYESEINIGIFDNKVIKVENNKDTYNKKIRYTENTKLIFPLPNATTPALNITNPRYREVIKYCYGLIHENQRQHYKNSIFQGLPQTIEKVEDIPSEQIRNDGGLYYLYINNMSEDQIITGLVEKEEDAYDYTKNTKVTTISYTTPSVAAFLVDNWMARWDGIYKITEEETKNTRSSGNNSDEEYTSLEISRISANLLNGNSLIGTKLTNHSDKIKEEAIKEIADNTTISISPRQITDNIIKEHLNICHDNSEEESCQDRVKIIYSKEFSELDEDELETILQEILSTNLNYNGNDEEILKKIAIFGHVEEAEEIRRRNEEVALRRDFIYNQLPNNINYEQWPTVEKTKANISYELTTTKNPYTYEQDVVTMENEATKFKDIINKSQYIESKRGIINRSEWFWDYIRKNEDTVKLEDALKVMFNIAFDTEQFGAFSQDDIGRTFSAFEPIHYILTTPMGYVSPFGCVLTREEFIESAEAYGDSVLSGLAADFYDICTMPEYDVNPCLAYGWAALESGWGDSAIKDGTYNLFQMGTYNGQTSGFKYASFRDSIKDFCKWIVDSSDPTTDLYKGHYERAKEFADVNSKFYGTPDMNIYALFSRYSFIGYTHDGNSRAMIAHTYKFLYNEDDGIRCKHKNDSDPTTLQERADYVQYTIELRLQIATDVFGQGIFLGGTGQFPEFLQSDPKWGTNHYGGPRGRPEVEGNEGKQKTIGSSGCGSCALAMIVSGYVGQNVTPDIFVEVLDQKYSAGQYYSPGEGSYAGVLCGILDQYGCSFKNISSRTEALEALRDGYAVLGGEKGHFLAFVPVTEQEAELGFQFRILDSARGHGGLYRSFEEADEVVEGNAVVTQIIYPSKF